MKTIYLIRHSAPFIDFDNYKDYKNVSWEDYNRNMILSVEGEKNASKLALIDELKDIDEIYSADSFRAIGTAKYIAEANNIMIKLDPRINERNLGVSKISELPDNFTLESFNDKNLKTNDGESLINVDRRFDNLLYELLEGDSNRIVLSIHGIILLSFLQNMCDFKTDGQTFDISYNGKEVLNGKITNPDIYKVVYNGHDIVDISRIKMY